MYAIQASKRPRYAILVAAAVAALAAMPARAESPDTNTEIDRAVSIKSRAEVRAELEQARRDGTLNMWTEGYHDGLRADSGRTRPEVRAEARANRRAPQKTDGQGNVLMTLLSPKYHKVGSRVA